MRESDPLLHPPHLPRIRLRSLDFLRGVTIVLMLVVNAQAMPWVFSALQHPAWFGLSPFADAIFPNFLLMVGVSIPFSFTNRSRRRISRRCAAWKIVRRVVFLFAIGIALNTFPFYLDNIAQTWRPMGVLQRIAVVYGIGAVLFVVGDRWKRARLILTLWCVLALALWAALTFGLPIPSQYCQRDEADPGRHWTDAKLPADRPDCTVQSYLDRLLLGGQDHLYRQQFFDPEGLLSTLTASINTVAGALIGIILHRQSERFQGRSSLGFTDFDLTLAYQTSASLSLHAFAMLCAYFVLDQWVGIPTTKQLWTPTFVAFSLAVSFAALATSYLLVDIWPQHRQQIQQRRRAIFLPDLIPQLLSRRSREMANDYSNGDTPTVFPATVSAHKSTPKMFKWLALIGQHSLLIYLVAELLEKSLSLVPMAVPNGYPVTELNEISLSLWQVAPWYALGQWMGGAGTVGLQWANVIWGIVFAVVVSASVAGFMRWRRWSFRL